MIRLENVTYRYRDDLPPALLNINLEINDGESVCIMGANGSGKSTVAKLIAGLIKNHQGRLFVHADGQPAEPVGLLFQNPDNQMVAVTVEKEIAFALENRGIALAEMAPKIDNALRRLSIVHLRNRLTTELSVGEKQRVALAAVMVSEPSILILDEPDSYLDMAGKDLFRKLLKKVKDFNPSLTVIEITQYPEVAKNYERLLVFNQGRIAADGQAVALIENRNLCLKYGLEFDHSAQKNIAFPKEWQKISNPHQLHISKIELNRMSFGYPGGNSPVIRHFTGDFRQGEITAIVGPSGCGKSTLGMIICGIYRPDSGSVTYIDDREGEIHNDRIGGRVTASLQQPERQFFLHTSQAEVEFGPKNFGRPVSIKEIKEFFGVVGLPFEQFALRDPFTLSLGEKRRLAFASILSISPDFIVFDEPTCALDREGFGRFLLLAGALKKAGIGVIIITHDEMLVKSLADRIVAFDDKQNYWFLTREKYLAGETVNNAAVSS